MAFDLKVEISLSQHTCEMIGYFVALRVAEQVNQPLHAKLDRFAADITNAVAANTLGIVQQSTSEVMNFMATKLEERLGKLANDLGTEFSGLIGRVNEKIDAIRNDAGSTLSAEAEASLSNIEGTMKGMHDFLRQAPEIVTVPPSSEVPKTEAEGAAAGGATVADTGSLTGSTAPPSTP